MLVGWNCGPRELRAWQCSPAPRVQAPDRGRAVGGQDTPGRALLAGGLGVTEQPSLTPTGTGVSGRGSLLQLPLLQEAGVGSEPPEKERRRLKESFENYRRWARTGGWRDRGGSAAHLPTCPPAHPGGLHRKRALRKIQGEADREATTGSDNSDTEGS